jgi:hypothetical protein
MTRTEPEIYLSLTALRAAHFQLLQRFDAERDQITGSLAADITCFQVRAAATGAILDIEEDRADAQALVNYWTAVLLGVDWQVQPVVLANFDPTRVPVDLSQQCPYPGLSAFEEGDRNVFFGRRQIVSAAIESLRTHHYVAVLGISGSGKSSVAKAGLLPQLKEGVLPGSEKWKYYSLIPGVNPLHSLAETVCPEGDPNGRIPEHCLRDLKRDRQVLNSILNETHQVCVLFVDQFEELFTISDEAERDVFLRNLTSVVNSQRRQHYVVVTMRSEFDTYVAKNEELQNLFEASSVRLGPLSATALRQAIEKPALRRNVHLEPLLIDELVKQVLGEPAGLPLLQFTLMVLWQKHQAPTITLQDYQALGGSPSKILARIADSTYKALKLREDQRMFQELFLALVRTDGRFEVMRTRQRRATLHKLLAVPDRVNPMLDNLKTAGLIRVTKGLTPDEDLIEVTHEALLRNWPRLNEWIDERKNEMAQRHVLSLSAELWKSTRKSSLRRALGFFNITLGDYVQDYADLDKSEKEYVSAIKVRRRGAWFALVVSALLAVAGASASLWYRKAVDTLQQHIRNDAEERNRDIQTAVEEREAQLEELNAQVVEKQHDLDASSQMIEQQNQQIENLKTYIQQYVDQSPAMLFQNGHLADPPPTWRKLRDYRNPIESAAKGVGLVSDDAGKGTAFLVAPNIALTLYLGPGHGPEVMDFSESGNVDDGLRFPIIKTLFVSIDRPRIRVLELATSSATGKPLPAALHISTSLPRAGEEVAVIGYPFQDPSTPPAIEQLILGDRFGVKRVQPGYVFDYDPRKPGTFSYSCFTQRWDGGGPIIDIRTGDAVGIDRGGKRAASGYKEGIVLEHLLRNPEIARWIGSAPHDH